MGYIVTFADFLYLIIACILLFAFVINSKRIQFKGIICLGIILRLVILLCDLYHVFPIPNLGADSEAFHSIAYGNAAYGFHGKLTNYTDFLTLVYSLTGQSRMIGQLINVIFGIGVIVYGQKCLMLLNVERRYVYIATLILSLFPNLIIFSAGLLREAWCEFFITVSIYQFLKWFNTGSIRNFLISCAMVLVASYMHSGSIGVAVGYMTVYILYDKRNNRFRFSFRSVFASVLVVLISLFYLRNMDMFGDKLEVIDGENTEEVLVYHYNNAQGGGSDYLTNLPIYTMWQAVIFSPIKMIYFAFSPMPWNWRGFMDILAFCLDSIFYIMLCWGIIKHRKNKYIKLRTGLLISLLSVVFIFGIGVTNSGTAIRHRAKLLPLFVIVYCISQSDSQKIKQFLTHR